MAEIALLLSNDCNQKGDRESVMNEIELDQETRLLLDRVRHKRKTLSLFDMPPDLAEAAVWEIGKVVLDHQQLPLVQYNAYRWYLRELAKLLRTKTGWGLGLELEICLRKWVAFRLNPELLQALLRECYQRIGAMTPEEVESGEELTTKTQRHNSQNRPKSEVRMQNSEVRSANSGIGQNDERGTMNEVTTPGGSDE